MILFKNKRKRWDGWQTIDECGTKCEIAQNWRRSDEGPLVTLVCWWGRKTRVAETLHCAY